MARNASKVPGTAPLWSMGRRSLLSEFTEIKTIRLGTGTDSECPRPSMDITAPMPPALAT
jgi:hypothetical protein